MTATIPRKRSRSSKTEIKMSLVAKRLAMLQDDSDLLFVTAAVEDPKQCERGTKPLKESSDDSSADRTMPRFSANRRKYGSIKRRTVISDDEETLKTRFSIVKAEPEKKSHSQTKVINDDEEPSKTRLSIVKVEPEKKSHIRDFTDDFNPKSPAIERANEVQASLSDEYPSFVKPMLRSHVTQGFWLGLPKKFCDSHLPACDCTVVLVDENGKECETKLLGQKSGLSAGWRGFSIQHSLQEGDVVVFQLIKPTTFKVYIVRADIFGEADGALSLLNLDACAGQLISDSEIRKEDNSLSLEENVQGSSDIDVDSEMVDGICFSDTITSFEDIKSFESFKIVVDGLILDSKFSENVRKKYYELCRSQGAFLHQHVLGGLNCNLVAGIISETVNISDAIQAYKATTTEEHVLIWDRTLRGLEVLGMNVSLLFSWLHELGLGTESGLISVKLRESMLEQLHAGERMKALEAKLLKLKENMEEIDLELTAQVNESAHKHKLQMKDKLSYLR